jgi:hypothetical protein
VTLVAVFPRRDDDMVFRSYSELLRWLVTTQDRSAATLYLGTIRPDGTLAPMGTHLINRLLDRWRITPAQAVALVTVQSRYRRYCYYLTEVLPEWQDGERLSFMDNSVEVIQTNRWGGTRTVMAIPPRGDLC